MPTAPPVAIIGLGLIGGSFALSLTTTGREVWAHDTNAESLKTAATKGITPHPDLDVMLKELPADSIVVLATPLPIAQQLLPKIAAATNESVTITDVVSVKTEMACAAREAGLAHRFVGAHPMAGTTESGFNAASAELLNDAMWVVIIDDDTDLAQWTTVTDLVLATTGRVAPADSEWHDHATAWISHLPHVIAELLASNVEPRSLAGTLAAGSFRDMTRVAGSRPELVEAMLTGNRRMLTEALESFLDQLEHATIGVRDGDVSTLVTNGHFNRIGWEQRRADPTGLERRELSLSAADIRDQLRDLGCSGGFIVSRQGDRLTALG